MQRKKYQPHQKTVRQFRTLNFAVEHPDLEIAERTRRLQKLEDSLRAQALKFFGKPKLIIEDSKENKHA
jgi:hypothetical protein